MDIPKTLPLKKDYMAEAFAIANGLPGAPAPRKEHVKILASHLTAYAEQFKKLQISLTQLFSAAKKQAEQSGKSFPHFPDVMKEEDFLAKLKEINEKTSGSSAAPIQKPMAQNVSMGKPGPERGLPGLPVVGKTERNQPGN